MTTKCVKKPDMSKMTLREKIAQTMIVRQSDLLLRADKDYDELRAPHEAEEIVRKNQFGGIWLHGNTDVNGMSAKYNNYFKFTSKTSAEWVNEVEKDVKIPIICANDAGGRGSYSDLSTYPAGLIVGAANSEELAFELGRCMGLEHKAAGCNWIWSPNVDMMNRFACNIVRPFSNIRDQQIEMCAAFVKGMQSVGVAACAKHFPGADANETRDSHVVTTCVRTSPEEWKKEQGAVFQAMVDAGVYTIMSGGKMCPKMDDTKVNGKYLPTGLSKRMLIDLLKGEMGFEGVIVTDDVNMGGFTSHYGHDELYARFLEAGNDMLLGVGTDAVDLVEDCVKRGIVTEERIDDACRRVLALKEKLGLFDEEYVRGDYKIEEIAVKTQEVAEKIARKGATLLRNRAGFIPLKQEIKHVTIFTYTHREGIYQRLNAMKEAFEERGATVSLRRRPESFGEVSKASEESDLIIYVGYIGHFAPKGAPSFYDEEFWALRYAFTAGKEKSIGVSLGYPFIHYYFMDDADTFVNLYTPDERVQRAFVEALYEGDFQGVAPLNMEIE